MNKKSGTAKDGADKLVRGIKRKTGKHHSAEETIRIALAGLRDEKIVILEAYAYSATSVPSNEPNRAIWIAAQTEAMITGPVCEGRSMQGMMDLVKTGHFPDVSNVLYAHLSGAPALHGYACAYRTG